MKKIITFALFFIASASNAASLDEYTIAPAEYKKANIQIHHADCITTARVGTFHGYCAATVELPQLRNVVITSLEYPRLSLPKEDGSLEFDIERTDMKCAATVKISKRSLINNLLKIKFTFTKLTRLNHPSVITCSKRLFDKFGSGDKLLNINFNYMAPAL